jgi:hypothetical protein
VDERLYYRLVAPATVVMAVMAVVVAVMAVVAWRLPPDSRRDENAFQDRAGESVAIEPEALEADTAEPADSGAAGPKPVMPVGNPAEGARGITEGRLPADSAEPVRVSLGDGEQAVILGGRASLAVAFTRVGEKEFPSLRVEDDSGPRTLALLGPGGRLELTAAGRTYVASVLRRDDVAKRLDLQVDLQQ